MNPKLHWIRRLWDRFSREQRIIAAAFLVSYGGITAMAIAILALVSRPQQVWYVGALDRVDNLEQARANYIKDHHVALFAHEYVANIENFSPITVDRQLDYGLRLVHPGSVSTSRMHFEKRASVAKARTESSHFLLDSARTRVFRLSDRYRVVVVGLSVYYSYNQILRFGLTAHHLDIIPAQPTDSNPYGLWILNARTLFVQADPKMSIDKQIDSEAVARQLGLGTEPDTDLFDISRE